METSTEYAADLAKTPSRTRRSSATQVDPTSQNKRSSKKSMMSEIEETESSPPLSDPVTPSRSARVLDFQTPSRTDALTAAQTPRRSVRKSVKPVQEYENIVAQKGLSAKRAASSSIDDGEETTEGKWVPAVIGRASTKRNKKARRAKKKQLQRQQKIVEGVARSTDVDGVQDLNELNDDIEKVNAVDSSNENLKDSEATLQTDEKLNDTHVVEDQQSKGQLAVEEKASDVSSNEIKNMIQETQSVVQNPIENDEPTGEAEHEKAGKEENVGAKTSEQVAKEIPTSDVQKDENTEEDITDSSMEGGDIEMATMPITADDMESPQKPFHLTPIVVATKCDSVNKSNDSDCIMLESSQTDQSDNCVANLKSIHDSYDSIETNMPPLLMCSDDEEEGAVNASNKPEEIKAIAPEQKEQPEEKPSPQEGDKIISLDGTFEVDESPTTNAEAISPQTPKLRSSITRIPTPFKSNKVIVPDKIIEPEEEMDSDDIPEIVLEPREVTLKSSRKRSFSICAVRPKKIVTFHSPANTTVSIYDGDLMKSTTKEDTNNITQRRKRSLSVTETEKEVMAYFEQKETVEATPDKQRKLAQPRSRTKMPNFNAIHQQQFQRMESISDHVARKAERAKILSASKVKPASIQKGLPVKNSVLRDSNKDTAGNKATLPVPKARQRIELSGIEHKFKFDTNKTFHSGMKIHSKSKPDLSTLDDLPSIGKSSSKLNATTSLFTANTKLLHLPKPKFETSTGDLSSIGKISSKINASTNVFTATPKPVHLPKPRFDTTVSTLNAPLNSTKVGDRRKRLMDMYKARTEPRTGERNKEILKGVRTNRRFELQMMCRNRPN